MAAAWRCPYSDLRRLLFSVASTSRSLLAPAKMDSAARWSRLSQKPEPCARLLDRMEPPSVLGRPHLQISGAFSRSQPGSPRWWWRLAVEPGRARSFRPGWGRDRQFGRTANPDRLATKRHLYIVVDDQDKGYSIHKLDIDDNLDADSSSPGTLQRLSGQPVVRIGPPNIGTPAQFSSLGSCIIAIGPTPDVGTVFPEDGSNGVTLIYYTKTAMLTLVPLLPSGLRRGYNLAVAVRNRLYMIESCTEGFWNSDVHYYSGGLHCLAANRDDHCLTATDRSRDKKLDWRQLPDPSGFSWSWSNYPSKLWFDAETIIAHAVHPRGRTIFVSVAAGEYPVVSGTYSYGTGSGRWRRCGDWMLPFKGQAHYDYELDAWVGLHLLPVDFVMNAPADGYICACSVTSAAASRLQPPKWKVGREKLFFEDPDWRHMDAKLVYMGEGSMYCLIERLQPKEEGPLLKTYGLRLTTFRVKYGEDGELVTVEHRPAGFYEVLSYSYGKFVAQAFWM